MRLCCALALLILSANILYAADECGDNGNFWADVDILYWQPWEKSMVLTNKESPVLFTDDFTKKSVIHPDFDWDFGTRIGLGYFSPCYPFDAALEWTYYHTCADQHRTTNSNDLTNTLNQEGMFPIWALSDDIIAGDYVAQACLNWKLTINLIDLEFGCPYTFENCFELRPYVGLRSAWIRQHANIGYTGGIFQIGILSAGVPLEGTDGVHLKNDFWGLGPRLGVEPRYTLGCGFSLYGNAAVSGLLGVYSINQREVFLNSLRFSHHKHPVRFRWIGDLEAGIEWETPLCCEQYLLSFKLGYEYHIFYHQLDLEGDEFGLVPHDRNLDVQGVTFSCGFAF